MRRFIPLFFLLLPLCLSGQNPPSPQLQPRTATPPAPTSSGADRQITIDVQVTDKSGAPIRGLQQQDFTLLDDKQPREIRSFQAVDNTAVSTDPAVEMVMVVDAVNTSFQAVTFERQELKKFLLRNGGKLALPTSLVFVTDTGTKMQNGFSRDGNALATLYEQYETGLRSITRSSGIYGAAERFDLSLRALSQLVAYEGSRPGRKLIVWFSPGWPLLSGPRVQPTHKDEENLFRNIVSMSDQLRQAGVTLYSIDPLGMSDAGGFRTFYYKEFVKGVPFSKQALPGNLGLPVLVVQSGGRVFNSSNDLTSAIVDCTADAEAFYAISFDSAKADHANEYHAIGVTVDKPGATARTRTGYYAQP
jgi:VWFA-related protein